MKKGDVNMLTVIIATLLVIGAELLIKRYVRGLPNGKKPFTIMGGRIEITESHNKGIIMGVFRKNTRLAKILHSVAALGCILVLIRPVLKSASALFRIGSGLVIGGGLSNLADRLINGYVTDYFRFCRAKWKRFGRIVFNLADMCVFLGAALVLVFSDKK